MTKRLKRENLWVGTRCFYFNSKLNLFPGKLEAKWTGLFLSTNVFLHGAVDLESKEGEKFTVNGKRIKIYLRHAESVHEVVDTYLLDEF